MTIERRKKCIVSSCKHAKSFYSWNNRFKTLFGGVVNNMKTLTIDSRNSKAHFKHHKK
jgi:hypothetical protein